MTPASSCRDPSILSPGRRSLERVSGDAPLRDRLARRGVVAAEHFTWAKVGRSFAALLRRVVTDDARAPAGVDTVPARGIGREERG